MIGYHSIRDLDWPLLFLTLALCALGVLEIFSATHGTEWSDAWWKQLVWISAGLVILLIVSAIDYHNLLERLPLFYVLSLVTLVGVLLFGATVSGRPAELEGVRDATLRLEHLGIAIHKTVFDLLTFLL